MADIVPMEERPNRARNARPDGPGLALVSPQCPGRVSPQLEGRQWPAARRDRPGDRLICIAGRVAA